MAEAADLTGAAVHPMQRSAQGKTALVRPMITQAFVLGAGLGMRLRPLTEDVPKPLVPIFQKPLITFALDHLAAAGVESFVINTHHLPNHFEAFFADGHYGRLPVRLVHEPVLLETGGGIKNAESLLGTQPFIAYSGDVLTDLPLAPLLEEHFKSGNDVTLALRQTGIAANVAFRDGRILDIGNRYGHTGNFDYANVSVWNPQIFQRIPPDKKISFIPILAEWIGAGGKIGGVVLDQGRWYNLGSPAEYLAVHRAITEESWRPAYVRDDAWPVRIAADASVDPTVEQRGCTSIGAGCDVGAGAQLEDTILWPGARIASQARLKRCIVRTRRSAEGVLSDTII
ncbi:MAG: sugar phosphate nucleotidyltransferase [Spartobacteria bacterium]